MKTSKKTLTKRQLTALLATDNPLHYLRAAGWKPRDFSAVGWTLSDFSAAGWKPRDFSAAAWTPKDFSAVGWTPSSLRAAGWKPSDLKEVEKLWKSIPKLDKPYTRLLADIKAKRRIHNQHQAGPDYDPGTNLCNTQMCTAGHLINMAGEIGYKLQYKYGWKGAARLIHMKSRPDVPPQNFGGIPQEFAMAYIEERAAEEQRMDNA